MLGKKKGGLGGLFGGGMPQVDPAQLAEMQKSGQMPDMGDLAKGMGGGLPGGGLPGGLSGGLPGGLPGLPGLGGPKFPGLGGMSGKGKKKR